MKRKLSWGVLLFVGALVGIIATISYQRVIAAAANPTDASLLTAKSARLDCPYDPEALRWSAIRTLQRLERVESPLNRKERVFRRLFDNLVPDNGSSVYNILVYHRYKDIFNKYGGTTKKMRMLEIGPGLNLGTGLLFSIGGVDKYYGLDIFRFPYLLESPQYENIVELLSQLSPQEIVRQPSLILTIKNDQVTFNQERVEYLCPHQSYDIPLADNSLDFVFSNVTLEHVSDPAKTVTALHRVLKKGGITVHEIGLNDHANFGRRPFEFLKYDAATWDRLSKKPETINLYTNRWRASDFKTAFEKEGFEVLEFTALTTAPCTEEMRRTFDKQFRSKSLQDLSIITLRIVAQKR